MVSRKGFTLLQNQPFDNFTIHHPVMSTIQETRINNCYIAESKEIYKNTIGKVSILREVEELTKKIKNINSKVTAPKQLDECYSQWNGCTVLHLAAMYREKEIFFYLLDKGADFTLQDNDGDTALHYAITQEIFDDHKDISVVMAWLKNRNVVNISDKNGFSYFHIACMANDVELVQQFISNGESVHQAVASKSQYFPGYTPLHFTIKYCAFEVAEVLLLNGANNHEKDSKGMTPVHVLLKNNFCSFNSTERKVLGTSDHTMKEKIRKIMGLLFESYTNIDMLSIDDIGLSNLHVACAIEDLSTAESIIKNNIDINQCVNEKSHLWEGYTALHFAALFNVESVKLLMRNGADIEKKDAKGITPFDLCLERLKVEDICAVLLLNPAWKNIVLSNGQTKLLDLVYAMRIPDELEIFLENFDAETNFNGLCIPNDSPLYPGYSPMHLAIVLSGNTHEEDTDETTTFDLMRVISNKNHTMLYKPEIHRWTPLHLAYRLDKQNAIKSLLKLHSLLGNSPRNAVDEDGLSYMHIACAISNEDFLEKLLSINSNVNAVYESKLVFSSTIQPQSTPLHVAVTCDSSIKILEMLLEHGANVNAKDANDMTPIHLSMSSSDDEDICPILLSSSNLKDSIVNGVGLGHFHVASYYGHVAAMERLVADGADINQVVLEGTGKPSYLSKYTSGYTPLIFAIQGRRYHGNDSGIKWLTERGAKFFVNEPSSKSLLSEMIRDDHAVILPQVSKDVYLQNHVRIEIGLTPLHLACYKNDHQWTRDLLKNGDEHANAQIYETSPSWPGFTPLHVIMSDRFNDEDNFDKIIELLIHKGTDVTLVNKESDTPLHLAYERLQYNEKDEKIFAYVNRMLEAQRDFSINPANADGLTHFHIACALGHIAVIKEFFKYDNVDVNQPLNYFSDEFVAECTPLHMAYGNELSTTMQKLQTVELLLAHGADANAPDTFGSTILHRCVHRKFFDLFETLIRHGADANARDRDGDTPLQRLIDSTDISAEDIKTLLRLGCRFNVFSTSTEEGYIGLTLKDISYEAMESLIPALTVNFSHLIETDDMSRTAIHNIVSVEEFEIPVYVYATLIEKLTETGCDIDDQDRAGRTALHLAAKFCNFKAISALLMLGADINVTDSNGKTPLTCDFGLCNRQDRDNDDINDAVNGCSNGTCQHFKMFETFGMYVKKLQLCGLDIDHYNKNLALEAFQKFPSENIPTERFFKELEETKNAKIGLYSLSLKDFISENGAVADYPMMYEIKRKVINKFFSRGQTCSLRQKFSETAGILQLQYRKAVARVQLVEDGRNSLINLLGFKLPDICSEMVLKFLTNSDLKILNSTADIVT